MRVFEKFQYIKADIKETVESWPSLTTSFILIYIVDDKPYISV